MSENTPLLQVVDLTTHFPIAGGGAVRAVDSVSFTVNAGETFGLVGESGCGKTSTGRSILQLVPVTSGQVLFQGTDLTKLSRKELRPLRKEMQIIFQDPFSSLNPRMTIGQMIEEPLMVHKIYPDKAARRKRVEELLDMVGLQPDTYDRYPHEFSGGQRQRIGIARALSLAPKLIVCDEPVSALDVSIQSQIINLLDDLQGRLGLAYIFIAHSLNVVKHISDRIAVMYLGKIVEIATSDDLFANPLHPYTQALLSAIPVPAPGAQPPPISLEGDVPSPANPPAGCRFHTRCKYCVERCRTEEPVLTGEGGHQVACHLYR